MNRIINSIVWILVAILITVGFFTGGPSTTIIHQETSVDINGKEGKNGRNGLDGINGRNLHKEKDCY